MLCYVMLCCVVLCYVMLCCVVLCCVVLCYVMLCYVMLCCVCYVMSCCVVLCYVMLCYVVLCCVVLCYVMLCYVVYVMLCYAMLCYAMLLCYIILYYKLAQRSLDTDRSMLIELYWLPEMLKKSLPPALIRCLKYFVLEGFANEKKTKLHHVDFSFFFFFNSVKWLCATLHINSVYPVLMTVEFQVP